MGEKDEKRGNLAGDWGGPFPLAGPSFADVFFFFCAHCSPFFPTKEPGPRLVYSTPSSDFELEDYDFWRDVGWVTLCPADRETWVVWHLIVLENPGGIWLKTQFSIRNPSFLHSTFNPILTMPVKTDTFENSTELKISIRSENNFCMLLRRLESKAVLKEKRENCLKIWTCCMERRSSGEKKNSKAICTSLLR